MSYHFLTNVLLRNPFYSYDDYSLDKIAEIILDPYFQCALYLASPQLYEMMVTKRFDFKSLNPREQFSLLRYYNRMSFRPTPFGSFSSFTLTAWGEQDSIHLASKEVTKLHLNIDQEVVLQLACGLTGNEVENHSYTCNPALYKWVKDFRFIKTSYSEDKKNIFFDLESIESNALTTALFNFCNSEYKHGIQIIACIMKITGCDRETAKDYLNFLVDANIFISHTATNIIGDDYLKRLLHQPDIPLSYFRQTMSAIFRKLESFNFSGVGQLLEITDHVNKLLLGLKQKKAKQIFYAGLEGTAIDGNLASLHQLKIADGLKALRMLVQPVQSIMLQQFIQDFKARYDKQQVLLIEAIDPEIGIGYGPLLTAASETDLLRHVNFTEQRSRNITLEWSAAHRLLLKRWKDNSQSTDPIQLDEADLLGLPSETLLAPATLPVLFRVIDDRIYMETIGGASATALIGRFTVWSKDVHQLTRELVAKEQSANPNVIFADIGQLSDTHADNINRRQHIYDYEIPINSVSTFPAERQIALSDLWVSVVGNELVMESKILHKVIIPRLTSAYNYSHNNLAVFRLLCDLQYQGLQGNYSLDLEQYFPGMAHYPRVVYKQTILSAAAWHLSVQNIKSLKEVSTTEAIARFNLLRDNLRLPAVIALRKFDQQLVFNIDNENEVAFLVDCLKSMDKAIVQEFFIPAKSTVLREGKPLINQFIAFLYKNDGIYDGAKPSNLSIKCKIRQSYILGSRWLYLKLYCTSLISNALLVTKLLPLLKQFDDKGLLSWFFIRYRDSGYHIRLRLKIKEVALGHVLSYLKKRLADTVQYHLIREYQADTYRREMERYGSDIIELVEGFFYGSSELILRYIKITGTRSFPYSYHSLAFVSISDLLSSFMPETDDQISFLEQMVNTFYAEFASDKALKIELDQKFRELKTEINGLLANEEYYKSLHLEKWADLYRIRIANLLNAVDQFESKRKIQLLADLIHMHLNRLFVDRQRNQELVVYYCLYKYQVSVKAMKKKNS